MANYLVLTGGSHGIGEKTLDIFIKQGWQAVNISRTNAKHPKVRNFNIDLSVRHWQDQFSDQLQELLEEADKICLVHNAAAFHVDSVMSLDEDDFRKILNTNLVSPMTLNQILLPDMKAGSSILYIGSTLSEQAVANRASYVISKHAIVGMMRATCQDIVDTGIHTACICPGFVNTGMLNEHVSDQQHFQEFIQSKVIAKRLIEPEEIAEFIYFCALNPLINGSVLHANLGQVAT